MNIPLVRPAPPQLSLALAELKALEESGIFSNFGPVNTAQIEASSGGPNSGAAGIAGNGAFQGSHERIGFHIR